MVASPAWGTHELKGGFEHFTSTRVGGNSQSASGYVFSTDYKVSGMSPALDAGGRLIPRFVPGSSRLATWFPVRGATIDVRTASLFVTDRWTAGPRLTLDLGARFETVSSDPPVKAGTSRPGSTRRTTRRSPEPGRGMPTACR